MKKLKPYKVLWWTIPVTFLPSVFENNGALDLMFHETYLVVSNLHVAIVCSLLLFLLGWSYRLLRSYKLMSVLSVIHSVGTSMSIIGITVISFLQTVYRLSNLELFRSLISIGVLLILVFLVMQIVFLLNLIVGLFNGKKKK